MHFFKSTNVLAALATALLVGQATAGVLAYGVCQSGCSVLGVACYSAAGFTFDTVAAIAAPPAIVACNTALGTCSGKCALAVLLPIL
jgi:hypothetical protein